MSNFGFEVAIWISLAILAAGVLVARAIGSFAESIRRAKNDVEYPALDEFADQCERSLAQAIQDIEIDAILQQYEREMEEM